MNVKSATYGDSGISPRVTPRSMQDCTLPNRQTPTQQLESCLPPDAKLWQRLVVGFLSLMDELSRPRN